MVASTNFELQSLGDWFKVDGRHSKIKIPLRVKAGFQLKEIFEPKLATNVTRKSNHPPLPMHYPGSATRVNRDSQKKAYFRDYSMA